MGSVGIGLSRMDVVCLVSGLLMVTNCLIFGCNVRAVQNRVTRLRLMTLFPIVHRPILAFVQLVCKILVGHVLLVSLVL